MLSIIHNLKAKIHQFLPNSFVHARRSLEYLHYPTMTFFAKLFVC